MSALQLAMLGLHYDGLCNACVTLWWFVPCLGYIMMACAMLVLHYDGLCNAWVTLWWLVPYFPNIMIRRSLCWELSHIIIFVGFQKESKRLGLRNLPKKKLLKVLKDVYQKTHQCKQAVYDGFLSFSKIRSLYHLWIVQWFVHNLHNYFCPVWCHEIFV